MSWSNSFVAALSKYGETLTGNSKEEFDSVKEQLQTLVLQNDENSAVHLDANGHAYMNPGDQRISTLNVSLRKLGVVV